MVAKTAKKSSKAKVRKLKKADPLFDEILKYQEALPPGERKSPHQLVAMNYENAEKWRDEVKEKAEVVRQEQQEYLRGQIDTVLDRRMSLLDQRVQKAVTTSKEEFTTALAESNRRADGALQQAQEKMHGELQEVDRRTNERIKKLEDENAKPKHGQNFPYWVAVVGLLIVTVLVAIFASQYWFEGRRGTDSTIAEAETAEQGDEAQEAPASPALAGEAISSPLNVVDIEDLSDEQIRKLRELLSYNRAMAGGE